MSLRSPGPDFAESDCYGLIRVLRTWVDVRNKEGYRWPTPATNPGEPPQIPFTEMYKSRLLLWLLQGHEPLPLPPPNYLDGPQHEVEVGGYAGWCLEAPEIGDGTGWREKGKLYWLFSEPWTILHVEPGEHITELIDYYDVTMPEHLTGTWRISRMMAEARGPNQPKVHAWEGRRLEP